MKEDGELGNIIRVEDGIIRWEGVYFFIKYLEVGYILLVLF